jgi:hypothetical protein
VKSFDGDVSQIPGWQGNDYDSIFVVRITHGKGKTTATFSRDAEGLNNLARLSLLDAGMGYFSGKMGRQGA